MFERKSSSLSRRRFAWLVGIASALNLVFMVGFPWAFLGRIEGGMPEFVYGVPPFAAALLLIPAVTGLLSVAAFIALVRKWRQRPASMTAPLGDSLVASALLSFVVFVWYWRLFPSLAS
jgi:hypothetical protein